VKITSLVVALGAMFASSAVLAGDAESGKRMAQDRCSTCHIIGPGLRNEVANSPPFEAIARKYDADMLVFAILDPHPRMNIRLTRPEAEDVAAYIHALAK
jgi:mono/diheme cytochrome c family protein